MFEVDDYIMYGMTGVCKVKEIKKENFANHVEKQCYVLDPVYSKNTIIKIPVDNKKIAMRELHSEDEVNSLIDGMINEEILWIENEKERNQKFKEMLKTGKCEELITLVKSIYFNKKHKKTTGNKIGKNDDEIMQTAERLLDEEFGTILNIKPEEVKPYILKRTFK